MGAVATLVTVQRSGAHSHLVNRGTVAIGSRPSRQVVAPSRGWELIATSVAAVGPHEIARGYGEMGEFLKCAPLDQLTQINRFAPVISYYIIITVAKA